MIPARMRPLARTPRDLPRRARPSHALSRLTRRIPNLPRLAHPIPNLPRLARRIRNLLTLLPLLLLACAADDDRTLALALAGDATCTAERLAPLASVSVEVYGDVDGAACTLARRCVTVADITAVADLEDALRAAMQPLIDTTVADTRQLAVLAHDRLGCGATDVLACGFADLADADAADALALTLRCEPTDCPTEIPPFCP